MVSLRFPAGNARSREEAKVGSITCQPLIKKVCQNRSVTVIPFDKHITVINVGVTRDLHLSETIVAFQ
jgi:hypothetical protein